MELARRLGKRPDPLPRRIVFMAFSGEEKGLLGSRHYVEHPLIPLDKTVMMINFDMVGRLNEKSELTIVGTGSTPGIEEIVDALGTAAGFKVKKVKGMSDGFGGSDHESFYLKNVPVLFPFTGLHADYHRPSDDTERINFAGMARIADFGEILLLDVARRPTRPAFTKAAETATNPHAAGGTDPGRVGMGAYLGTIPDYGAEDKGREALGRPRGEPRREGRPQGGRRDRRLRRQADRHDLRLHRLPRPQQAGRQGRDRRQARRQGRHPHRHPRQPTRALSGRKTQPAAKVC